MNKTIVLMLLLFSLTQVSCQTSRTENWSKDIDFLVAKIKKDHYVYKNKELPEAFNNQVQTIKKNISAYTDERMLIELERLMYFLGDGHSYILPFGFKLSQTYFLPIQMYQFSDGMYVINSDSNNLQLIGMKVVQIGTHSTEELMKDMVSFISQDNTMGAKWIGPFFLRFRGMLESYGLENGAKEVSIKFEGKDGKTFEKKLTFIPVPRLRGIPKLVSPGNTPVEQMPLYLQNVQTHYWLKEIPEMKAIYFQFNQVADAENESLSAFSNRLALELVAKRPQFIIVDVRHNNGGNADLTPPLLQVLKDYDHNQNGKIVVITGRNTFSAAQIFISKLEVVSNVIFAGEPSSSKPNFVGEETEVVLPYSGAIGSISDRYHESIPNDTRQWIEPDIEVSVSSKDFFSNRDPIMDTIFNKFSNRK